MLVGNLCLLGFGVGFLVLGWLRGCVVDCFGILGLVC